MFAFGISEAGNDLVLFGSDTEARPDGRGGYTFTGTKIFTSLSPVWDHLGVHGLDETSPEGPRMVFAFLDRSDDVVAPRRLGHPRHARHAEPHDRASRCARSRRPRHPPRRPGPQPDPLVFGIFAVFEILLASVYTGIARRAIDLAVEAATSRRSKKTGTTYANDPDIRWRVADMALAYDALPPQLASLASDVDTLVDHGARWFTLLSGVKYRAVAMAKEVVDDAVLVGGGSAYFSRHELSRLYRDVLAGMFHPSDSESAHSTAATAWLGPVTD